LGVPPWIARFAAFELDSRRYQLRSGDRVLKLEKIPMEVLTLLVQSHGHLVNRDQIIERIWGKGVFVDTEHGINTAIRKIRQALGDDPEQPRFVQTVTGKGYRFIAPTIEISERGNGSAFATAHPSTFDAPSTIDSRAPLPQKGWWPRFPMLAVAAGLALAFFAAYLGWRRTHAVRSSTAGQLMLAVLPFENLSGDPNEDYFSDGLTEEIITQLGALSRTSSGQSHAPLRWLTSAHQRACNRLQEN
jgi:DNA-binding winged helix-turn-helix (wHTH) protein